MPLKWSCGSTVFALDFHPSGAQNVNPVNPVNLWPAMKVLSYRLAFFLASRISDVFIHTSRTNNQCWHLAEHSLESGLDFLDFFFSGSGDFTPQCLRQRWTRRAGRSIHVPALLLTAPVCVLDTKQYGVTNLWNRISSSQATFTGFLTSFDILLGDLILSFGAQIQIWDTLA